MRHIAIVLLTATSISFLGCQSEPSSNRLDVEDAPSYTAPVHMPTEALSSSRSIHQLSDNLLNQSGTRFSTREEKCCNDPGDIAACWWEDARLDGAACKDNSDCSDDETCTDVDVSDELNPAGLGLCTCKSNRDCGEGICRDGVCGPSFCNGYLVCSCWGGCTEANAGGYENYGQLCSDTGAGNPGLCCEGNYPTTTDGTVVGYCSNFCPEGITICDEDIDCEDDNPCTDNVCDANNQCSFVPITDGAPDEAGVCAANYENLSADCGKEWCIAGECSWKTEPAGTSCIDNAQDIDSDWYGGADAHVRTDEADTSSCFFAACDDAGNCVAAPQAADNLACAADSGNSCTDSICSNGACIPDDGAAHEGERCDTDNQACTVEECLVGVCTATGESPCDDDNWCTSQDTCVDADPENHLTYECVYTLLSDGANAADYDYEDNEACEDIICYDGNETPTATVCTPPDTLNLTCNTYACDPLGEEDNCTAFPINDGEGCNDGNGCTLNEVCDNGACGSAATIRKSCDDENVCTTDYCEDGPVGNCVHDGAPHNGDACDDGDLCTGAEAASPNNDVCSNGVCTAGADRDCSGAAYNDQCHEGACDAATGACKREALEGATCVDGNPCTESDKCGADGTCAGTEKSCGGDQCNTGVCDSDTGNCTLSPVENGTDCQATDGTGLCTPNDTCQNGVCQPDSDHQVVCTGDTCNTVYCDPTDGTCKYDNADNLNKVCPGVLDDDNCTLDQCVGDGAGSKLTCTQVADNDITAWYDGDIAGTLTIDGNPDNADTLTDATLGEAKGYLLSGSTAADSDRYSGPGSWGWNGRDHAWEIVYTGSTSVTLTFSGCLYGGFGDYDGQMALTDCGQALYAQNDDGCDKSGMPEFSVTLTSGQTYFLMMDGYYSMSDGSYQIAIFYDTCSDGIKNGDEVAVDSGGDKCCDNGVKNGDEEAVDRGGSCCSDGIMNGDETEVDCGGDYCESCYNPCENGVLDPGELEVDCGGICPVVCDSDDDCPDDHVCNTDISACGTCLPLYCSGTSDSHLTLGHSDSIVLPMKEGCADVLVDDQYELNHIHYGDRTLKFQMMGTTGSSGKCKYNSPNYTYVYTTKYCVTYQGVSSKTYEEFINCPEWGFTSGTGRVTQNYYQLIIPVEQYTQGVRLSFIDDNPKNKCELHANIYWQ